ncbi:MAG: PD40 domain-containing protein [Bacteroidales bacterium]|nr:PD40 domain-containing protein [Bacteroidales bacterium]
MRLRGIILLIAFLFIGSLSFGQQLSEAEYELEQDAIEFFKAKKYEEALPLFSSLISVHPQEGFYNYCYGICLVEVNKDIPKAIEYLKFASGKDVKYFVYFYLGKANHLLYKFDEAIRHYNTFLQKGGTKDAAEYPAARYIEMCKNGKDLVQFISNLMVIENKTLRSQDFFYSYNLGDFGGKIIIKPKEFKTKLDIKKEEKGIMFMTDSNYVFYSSYGKNGKNGKDIYRSKKQVNGLFGEPEWLGNVINTSFDEDYPFLHPDGKTLYFCSKGHNSMGGYDIFRSVYDSVGSKWSKPENLDFPTNSPYDDLLFISDAGEDYAYFASARETGSDEVSIYKIRIDKNPVRRELREYEEIINLSKLNPNALADNNNNNNSLGNLNETNSNKANSNRKEIKFDKIAFDPNLSFNEIVKESDKDVEVVQEQYNKLNKQSKVAYLAANDKNKEANRKWQEAISIYEVVNEITNEEEKEAELNKAIKLEEEADILSKEAVVAFNLGSNLEKNAKEKEEELKSLVELRNSLTEGSDIEEMVNTINKSRENLNLAEEKYTSVENELEKRKSSTADKKDELDVVTEERIHNEKVVKSIENDISLINNQLKTEKNQESIKDLNSQLADLEKEKLETIEKRNNIAAQEEKLKVEVREMNNEIAYLEDLAQQASDSENSNNIDEKLSEVNKANLDKEIFDKELAADLNKAKEVADNISANNNDENNSANNNTAENNNGNTSNNNTTNDNNGGSNSDNNTNNTEENNNNENSNNSSENNNSNVVSVDKNTEEVVDTYKNPVAQNLFREARQNKMLSDSLKFQADTKRKILETVDDEGKRRIIENEIIQLEAKANEEHQKGNITEAKRLNNEANEKRNLLVTVKNIEERNKIEREINELEELAAIKKQQAVSKFTEAQVEENNYVASNDGNNNNSDYNNNVTNNNNSSNNSTNNTKDPLLAEIEKIDENPKFPFSESEEDSDLDKYQKELFKANYYVNLTKTVESRLEQMKGSVDTISDSKTQDHYKNEIVRLENILEKSKAKAEESTEKVEKLKPLVIDQLDGSEFTNEELLVRATSYQPTLKLNYSADQQNEIILINEDRNFASQNQKEYSAAQKNLAALNEKLEKSDDQKERKSLQKEIDGENKKFEENFNSYNKLSEQSNLAEYNLFKNVAEDVRLVNSDKDIVLANNLEKEAGLYFEKAKNIRANANLVSDNQEKAAQIHKADLMEQVAINKLKHATDLYLLGTQNTVVENNNSNSSNNVSITLSPEEEETLAKTRKDKQEAEILVQEAEKTLEEIEIKKQKADAIYSEKEKKKILKGTEEKENVAKQRLMAAYLRYKSADSIQYNLNKNQIIQISKSLDDVGTNKAKAKQYTKEADFYFGNAQKRWDEGNTEKNIDEKLKLMKSAVAMENQSLESQVFALDLLINSENTIFVASNSLTKIDLSSMNTPVNVDDVIKLGTQRIIKNIALQPDEYKAMDKTTEIEDVALNLRMDVDDIKKQIKELEEVIATSSNNKDKKKAEKEIEKLEQKMFASQFTEVELYGNINNTRFYVYQDNIKAYRIKGTSEEARQGRQLESDAKNKFNKAQSLREKAFMEQNPNKAYERGREAMNLEKEAIIDLEKAYSIYLGLEPLDEEIAEFQANKIKSQQENSLMVKSLADITPINIDTMNFNRNKNNNDINNLADNNNQIDTTSNNNNSNDIALNNNTETSDTTDVSSNNNLADNTNNNTNNDNNNNSNTDNNNSGNDNNTNNNTNENNNNENINDNNNSNTNNNNTENSDLASNNNSGNTDSNNSSLIIDKNIEGTNIVIPAQAIFKFTMNAGKSYSAENPIPMNEELPAGIVFKIQIGAFKTTIPDNTFTGLNPVSADKLPNSSYIKYLVGLFQTYEAAGVALTDVRNKGYRDAFIVAYKDGKRISLFEARNLINKESPDVKQYYDAVAQKETEMVNSKASGDIASNNNNNSTNENRNTNTVSTVIPVKAGNLTEVQGLLYTVQIGVYKTPVSKSALFNLDPIYQETTGAGLIRYTTGIFNTVDDAVKEKDKIVNIGIRDAFVTAYYNGKRISISEASRVLGSGTAEFAESRNTNSETIPVNTNNNADSQNNASSTANKIEFKVQIGAYKEQVPTNVVKSLLSVAAQRGLDQQLDEKGFTVYTVGNYTSYQEAKTTKEAVAAEGITDAFVVAFNNGKKISVEEALRLQQ